MTTARRIAGTASEWLREGRRVVAALLVEAAVVGEAKAICGGIVHAFAHELSGPESEVEAVARDAVATPEQLAL